MNPSHKPSGNTSRKRRKGRSAAQVGTDTATVYAISPEGLKRIVEGQEWVKLWEDGEFKEANKLIREHGGAVFETGGDGLLDVQVPKATSEAGFLPPYNTPEYGDRSNSVDLKKLSGLRDRLIKLAWENPEIRPKVLRLLVADASASEAKAASPPTFRAKELAKQLKKQGWGGHLDEKVNFTWMDKYTVIFQIGQQDRPEQMLIVWTDPLDGQCGIYVIGEPPVNGEPWIKIHYMDLTNKGDEILAWAKEHL